MALDKQLLEAGLRIVDRGGIRTLARFTGSAHNAGKATEHFERSTKNLTVALGSLGGYFGVRQLVEYADTWTLINARVNLVTKSHEQAMAVQEELFRIANQTRNTLAATSVLYTRLALNGDQLGRSHRELLQVVESVNAAMLLSGATGVEAAQAMRQIAQALGAGRVQGDEFRTMMEAMPLVARAVADEMGVALGDLYKLSEKGLIDVQTVIDALIERNEELVTLAEDMPFTVGQAFEVLHNSMTRMVGILNMAIGASTTFGNAILTAARNMDRIIAAVISLTSALVAYRLALIAAAVATAIINGPAAVGRWLDVTRQLWRLYGAMTAIRLATRGLASALSVAAALTIGIVAYRKALEAIRKATEEWINAQGDLNDILGESRDKLDEQAERVRHQIEDMIRVAHQGVVLAGLSTEAQERYEIAFDAVNKRIEARRELQGELLEAMLAAISVEERLRLEALEYAKAVEEITDAVEEQQAIIDRFLENIQRSFADTFEKIFSDGIKSFGDLFDAVKKLFFRFISEMAAARIMQRLGPSFSAVLGGMFGTSDQAAALQQQLERIRQESQRGHLTEALAGNGTVPVEIEGITVTASKSWAAQIAQFMGPVLAGFFMGRMVGGMTTSRTAGTIGGAVSGAASGAMIGSVIPGVGTAVGAIVGGISGALGGFLGASKRAREEAERLRAQLEANRLTLASNSLKLQQLRDTFDGRFMPVLMDVLKTGAVVERLNARDDGKRTPVRRFETLPIEERGLIMAAATQLGIELFDREGKLIEGSLLQLAEAIELTIRSLTTFGNNLKDVTSRQEAFNKLFDVEDTPMQRLRDQHALLNQLAPELMRQLGLTNLNLDSPEGRAVFLEGLREIFRMIENGDFLNDPELLGAFADKDQLLDAILATKDAFDELNKVLFDVVTDFPRAMDIAFYEQMFGRFTTGAGGDPRPRRPRDDFRPGRREQTDAERRHRRTGDEFNRRSFYVEGDIHIHADTASAGRRILENLEHAVETRRNRGGSVDLDRRGESIF